ncbi:hypothetical protein RDI58_030238 [Solanum bulbocastanum]|uniref:Uncharacterized protein n=2 Tax=Solanum bulbocastanum TaxID=147425 RepID=A0AAN8STL3_SOLBU
MSGAILKPRGQRCWRQTEATAGGRHGRPVGLVGVLRGRLMACMACPCYAVGRLQKHADDGLWGDRVPLRAFISTGLYAFGVETAVLSGERRVLELLLRLTLGAARPGHVRPCTARRYRWGGRGRCPRRNFSLPPTPLRHRRRGTACHAGLRGGCRACIDEAIHVRRMSGIGLARLGWIPASSSDVLTRMPCRWRIKRNLGLSGVGILCCIPNARALLACNRSPFAPRARRAGRTQKPLSRPAPSSLRRARARSASGGWNSRIR